MMHSITQKFLLIIVLILLSSCATVLKRKSCDIKVSSNVEAAQIQVLDSTYNLPAKFSVKRSKMDLPIRLISDTLTKNFVVKSSLNPTFIFGNLLWMEFCPAAYLIDLTNQKRFYYCKSIFLDKFDTTAIIEPVILNKLHKYLSKTYPTYKNQLFLTVSIPWVNNFYLQPNLEPTKFNTGFWGFSAGLDYFYSDTKFFNVSFSLASDFFLPVPAAVDIYGVHEFMYSGYVSFTHNYKVKRFNLGYGINGSANYWEFRSDVNNSTVNNLITKTSSSLGIRTNIYYQVGKHFFTGLIYRPSFLRIDPKFEFKYEHLLSIDFGWKIKL